MPVHDWSRVSADIFRDFRTAWMTEIRNTLNTGVLPPDYYALIEQDTENGEHGLKQKTLVIRHSSDDHIVALVKIVSPGNKASRHALRSFVEKVADALYRGYHLLILDLHPPGPRDPDGIHGAIWAEISDESYQAPPDRRLTLAAYEAGPVKRAWVEPIAVGDLLPEMPLFLQPGAYVPVPLEATYLAAYRGVPQRWRRVLEAPAS